MNRQKIGYVLTLTSLIALIIYYSAALFFSYHGNWGKTFLGASLTLIPLLYLIPSVIMKDGKSYTALAIISPIYAFMGGVLFLWDLVWQGIWVFSWAIILQVGTILYRYQRRKKKET